MGQLNHVLNQIAPHLQVVTYVGGIILLVAFLAFLARLSIGSANGLLKLSARLLILFGIFFLIHEAAEMFVGRPHSMVMLPGLMKLWVVGLLLLIAGILFRLISSLKPAR